ncbi:MAG: hypothetical protein KKC18_05780 [Chloroflexi bacterium]|nr:hypothetical protein [Chloroflexota bacterium]
MKKKLVVLTMVLAITLLAATPALAGRGGNGGGDQEFFALVGNVTAISNDTITVQTLNDRFAGQELTVQVTTSTLFFQWTPDGSEPYSFDEMAVGDSVNIKGTMTGGEYIASRVTVDVPLYCY